jgi:GH25 family lysozyme M1 (1,4-beta-N-acetylmuramidase)
MSLKGIDISNWQSNIKLSAINADFIIVKSSEGIG